MTVSIRTLNAGDVSWAPALLRSFKFFDVWVVCVVDVDDVPPKVALGKLTVLGALGLSIVRVLKLLM